MLWSCLNIITKTIILLRLEIKITHCLVSLIRLPILFIERLISSYFYLLGYNYSFLRIGIWLGYFKRLIHFLNIIFVLHLYCFKCITQSLFFLCISTYSLSHWSIRRWLNWRKFITYWGYFPIDISLDILLFKKN